MLLDDFAEDVTYYNDAVTVDSRGRQWNNALFAGQDGPDLGFLFDGQAAGVWMLSGQEFGSEEDNPLLPGKLLDARTHGRTRLLGGDDLIGQISL